MHTGFGALNTHSYNSYDLFIIIFSNVNEKEIHLGHKNQKETQVFISSLSPITKQQIQIDLSTPRLKWPFWHSWFHCMGYKLAKLQNFKYWIDYLHEISSFRISWFQPRQGEGAMRPLLNSSFMFNYSNHQKEPKET